MYRYMLLCVIMCLYVYLMVFNKHKDFGGRIYAKEKS